MIIFEAGSTVVNFLKFPRFTSGQNERQITEQISCILIIKEKLRIFARARSARHRRDGKKKLGGRTHFCPTHPKVARRVKNESKYRLIVA